MGNLNKLIPILTVCGSTGAGKSSLVNALMQADVRSVGVTPTTKESEGHESSLGENGIPVYLMDTPGVGEAGMDEVYQAKLIAHISETDLLLWVIGYDNRALDADKKILDLIRSRYPQLPIIILGNAVDRASRKFDPDTFNPENGSSDAERNVSDWLAYLKKIFENARPAVILPCAAGEEYDDTKRQYNLRIVSEQIEMQLPDAMRVRWLRFEKTLKDKGAKSHKIILAATATAGTIGLVPLPMADMPFIIATQVTMILSLCKTYERPLSVDTAKSLALAALSAVAGPMLFQTASKLIPGFGSVVGASVAAGCTFAVGKVTQRILASGQEFELKTFKNAVKDLYKQYRKENKKIKE
jgi:GTP-binding protein Era